MKIAFLCLILPALALAACSSGGSAPPPPMQTAPTATTPTATTPAIAVINRMEVVHNPSGSPFLTLTRTGPETWDAVTADGQSGQFTQIGADAQSLTLSNDEAGQWWRIDLDTGEIEIGDHGSDDVIGTHQVVRFN